MSTGVALLDMPPELRRAATLDRAHDTVLTPAEGVSVVLTVGGPGLAEDVRHLDPGGAHAPGSEMAGRTRTGQRGIDHRRQEVKGTVCRAHGAGGHLQVARGRGQAAMAEQQLDGAHIGA